MEIQSDHQPLPFCWHWSNLGDIISFIGSGITPKGGKSVYQSSGIPFIRSQNVYPGNLRLDDVAYINAELHESMSRTHILPNDVLLNITGASIGRSAVIPPFFKDGNVNQHVCILRLFSQIDSNYISWFLNSPLGQKQIMDSQFGVTRQGLNYSQARMLQVPLAPFSEQYRIVNRIEELFSRLDAGVEALKKAKVQLHRYRQSVLKAAVEGKLTEEWRKAHPDVDPSEKLLERILRTGGSFGSLIDSPYDLPDDWTWIELGTVLARIEAGKNFRCEERPPSIDEVGVVKVSAVTWGKFDEAQSKTCTDLNHLNPNYFIKDNDFLFSRANTIELVGACVIVGNIYRQLMLSDKILRFNFKEVPSKWILYVLRSKHGRREIENLATGNQESMRNISQDKIRRIRIPIPPRMEIIEIIEKIEYLLSTAESAEKSIDGDIKRAGRLRQSILKTSFEGNLVPQNPNEEPASVLIERIRAERANGSPRMSSRIKRNNTQQMRLIQ
jgi:type I restriction enzyme, S subunit